MTYIDNQRSTSAGWLLPLTLATFVIGTDDFIIAGILPEIAEDLGVSETAAGQLVTVFSITYALAAPPLAVVTARLPRKPLVAIGLSFFALINVLTAFAPIFGMLLMLRVLAALVAAAISPAVFGLTAQLAVPERVGRSLGVVAAGLTISLFVGVPLGSLLATTYGWRSTFVAVALFSFIVVLLIIRMLPPVAGAPEVGVRQQLRILKRPAVLSCVLGTVMGASGGLLVYTYISPITDDVSGQDGAMLAVFIAVVGVAGAVGTFVGGRLTDRWGADRALLGAFSLMAVAVSFLAIIGITAQGTAPLWFVVLTLAAYGFAGWGFNPPMNARALQLAGDAGTEAVALNTSALYVGISIAGAVGGAAIAAYGGQGAAVVAAMICLITMVTMWVLVRKYPSSNFQAESSEAVGSPPEHQR